MGSSRKLVLAALGDHKPKSLREVVRATGLTESAANNSLHLCWKLGLAPRAKEPIYEFERDCSKVELASAKPRGLITSIP